MRETEDIIAHPKKYKSYNSFQEWVDDIEKELEEDE